MIPGQGFRQRFSQIFAISGSVSRWYDTLAPIWDQKVESSNLSAPTCKALREKELRKAFLMYPVAVLGSVLCGCYVFKNFVASATIQPERA